MLVFTLLLSSALGATELYCTDGIVDFSRPYMGKMSRASCKEKAERKGVSFVYGNGNRCHHYKKMIPRNQMKASDGKGHWETCSIYQKKVYAYVEAGAKVSEGPDIMCVVGEYDFYYSHEENRCGNGYEVNRFTGKCVSAAHESTEPATCASSCGSGFCCHSDSGLCLKCKTESAPAQKLCDDIYGCVYQPCRWWDVGETANEEALGLSFESDEQAESIAVTTSTSIASGFDVAVEVFAALGFAITLYGAYQHYTK